eukprot:CAMPEP_0168503508 /NCGR_PEP_ID=MMETSP0228-20121227/75896_1 /TAXON_ID=133427 /ORGANISM="Protoceratium reticulatum, Strain CCCM 535 (=CCMP 1889)" /LENGTH=65 /DNA_ID=CAMNT_0008520575 /DNA_START=344 /DNA_END=538 /DNA_ORIENTATION=-
MRDLLQGSTGYEVLGPGHVRLGRHDASDLHDDDLAAAQADVQAQPDVVRARGVRHACVKHVQALV